MSAKRILGLLAIAAGLLVAIFGVWALFFAVRFTVAQPIVLLVGIALSPRSNAGMQTPLCEAETKAHMCRGLILVLLCVGALTVQSHVSARRGPAALTIDAQHPACRDVLSGGSTTAPFCSVTFAALQAQPGDVYTIRPGRYCEPFLRFGRHGTAAAPIVWQADGDVTLGRCVDLDDTTARPVTDLPDVWSLARPLEMGRSFAVFQTYFDPIVVDDPGNRSVFTMVDTDGPLRLGKDGGRPTLAQLTRYTGLARLNSTGSRLWIHPFGNRKPGVAMTDFVVATGRLNVEADHNHFYGFTFAYSTAVDFFGQYTQLHAVRFLAQPLLLRGRGGLINGLVSTHVIQRGETFQWHYSGQGAPLKIDGCYHRLFNLTLFHHWNASPSLEDACNTIVDGLRMFGSPNHATIPMGQHALGGNIIRNVVSYNSQDSMLIGDNGPNMVWEHITCPRCRLVLRKTNRAPKPVTIRNSIMDGINYDNDSQGTETPLDVCTYEADTVFENNLVTDRATFHHCANKTDYRIRDYIEKCRSGVLRGCMTMRNIRILQSPVNWTTVLKGGYWMPEKGDYWDVSLTDG